VVETPVEGTPAFEADVLPGDQIREVDGAPVKGLALMDVVRRIKGEPGTPVTLTLYRAGREPFEVKLVRRIIVVRAVKARMLEGGLGYIRISDFTEKMVEQFDEEVKKLLDQGARALVVDVRFNPGGLLNECVELADRFLDEGVIVTTRGRTLEDERTLRAEKGDTLPPLPLAVLVNEGSASASEIFAGAMKDHRRGVLVGARTFGKGSVQTPFELPGGGALKLTTARYFTPAGISVHRENGRKDYGIEPDYLIEMTLEEYDALKKRWVEERIAKGPSRPKEGPDVPDHQLEAALEVLRARIEGRAPQVRERRVPRPPPADD
ncbi:MAG: S41 family peptidase, partial [Planctomycetota bacterium]